ncbi:2349_t:CDS:2 [Paraglomus brasilianum]|uniref:2349_t:CDS:1 n=1 Tax=Paraglomus brasilianum TaxID=144538 RepID=A0A9N9BJ74_9GLOM|nr:2349_t:CDS:2 [Paraglomus brasilianum]
MTFEIERHITALRYRNPMRTEDFLNPVEEREIELVDEETIIQLLQEGG